MSLRGLMKLTFLNRVKICWETLTIRSGHAHTAQEKQLSIFQHGYHAGLKDAEHEERGRNKNINQEK